MKKLLIIFACLGAVAAVLFFVFRKKHQPAVDQEIAKRLVTLVHDGSKGLYNLQMDSLVANVVDSKLLLLNARLIPDTAVYDSLSKLGQAPADLFEVSIDRFSIDDITPVDFLTAKEINLDRIYLKNPTIRVVHRFKKPESEKTDSLETIYARLKDKVSGISIDTIRIEDANFTYENRLTGKLSKIGKVSFLASDFLLNEKTQADTTRFLFARNCNIRIQNYTLKTADSLYAMGFQDLLIETSKRQLVINQFKITPRVSKALFYKTVGSQRDHFNMLVNKVTIRSISWWKMLADEALQVDHVAMDNLELDIYNDRTQKPDNRSKMGKYPHQLLMKLVFGFSVDTIAVTNMRLAYNELSAKTGQKGTLQFSRINARMLNVTNDSVKIRNNAIMKVDINGRFMEEAPVQASFAFNLQKQRTGDFEVSMKLGRLSKESINKLTIPLGPARIDELNMKSLTCNISGNNNSASGTLNFQYSDLKVAVLKDAGDTLKKKKLLSFLANTFILKSANPAKGKEVTVAHPTFRRDPRKSFFNLVWKTIFTGIKQTAGL
jgi:hypothetical protein